MPAKNADILVLVKPLKKREELICINPKCVTWTPEFKEKRRKELQDAELIAEPVDADV